MSLLPTSNLPPPPPHTASFFPWPGPGKGKGSPRMMPLGAAGGCQISRTDVVLTSGNRMPTGGPGTGGNKAEAGDSADAVALSPVRLQRSSMVGAGSTRLRPWSAALCPAPCPGTVSSLDDATGEVSTLRRGMTWQELEGTRLQLPVAQCLCTCAHICSCPQNWAGGLVLGLGFRRHHSESL